MKRLMQIFIAIVPLIVSFSTSDPTLAIRFLVLSLLVSGLLIYYLVTNKAIYKEVITHPAIILFGIVVIGYLFSGLVNGLKSESIYVILKLFLLYVFVIIVVQFVKKEGYQNLLNSFVYFSLFTSAIYFFQLITNYSDIMSIQSEFHRNLEFDQIASTMGHKNLLSSIQFLILPILIYKFMSGKKFIKVLSSIALILILITFFQTQTRAVFIALVISSIAMLILNKEKINKRLAFGVSLSIILLLSSGYALMKYTKRYDAFANEISKTLEFKSSLRYRLYKSSLQLIKEHPIIGVGPGNWSIDIWKYGLYETEHSASGQNLAQRPHNDFLWVFSEGGLIAGISYILLFLILLRESYLLHRNRKKEDGVFYSLLFSCFLGFGFISLVDFPLERFSHNIIFFVLAAFVIGSRIKNVKTKIPTWLKLPLIGIVFFTVYVATIRYQGEIHAANAIEFKTKAKWNFVIKAIEKSYNKNYYEMENTSTPLLWYRGLAYFNQKRYDLAMQDFKDAYKVNSYHVHVLNNLATLYEIKGNSTKAKKLYRAVFDLNPTFKESRVNLAAILFNEKKYIEALDIILASKVDNYWKRKDNNDNYDLYLKTIFQAWVKSIINNSSEKEQEVLNRWSIWFNTNPLGAAKKAKYIFEISQKENIDYLTTLMLEENKK